MVDANILVAGTVWPRWPYEVLRHAVRGDFQLLLSPRVIDEAMLRIADYFPDQAGRFRRQLAALKYEIVADPGAKQVSRHARLLPDPDDVPIALAAINAKVDYFVSEDKHFTTQDERRADLHRRLKVMLSGTFLREVMGWTSEELERIRGRTWKDLQKPPKAGRA